MVMGVGSCSWPSFSSVVRMTSPSRALANKPQKYASAADAITFLEFQGRRGLLRCECLDLKNLGI